MLSKFVVLSSSMKLDIGRSVVCLLCRYVPNILGGVVGHYENTKKHNFSFEQHLHSRLFVFSFVTVLS